MQKLQYANNHMHSMETMVKANAWSRPMDKLSNAQQILDWACLGRSTTI